MWMSSTGRYHPQQFGVGRRTFAESMLRNFNCSKLFVGQTASTPKFGLTTNMLESLVKRCDDQLPWWQKALRQFWLPRIQQDLRPGGGGPHHHRQRRSHFLYLDRLRERGIEDGGGCLRHTYNIKERQIILLFMTEALFSAEPAGVRGEWW